MRVLEICFTCSSTMDDTKLFTYYCTWSRFGNSGVLPSWPVCDPSTGESRRLFLALAIIGPSLMPCAVWLLQGHPYCSVALPPASGQLWEVAEVVCTCLGSGGRFLFITQIFWKIVILVLCFLLSSWGKNPNPLQGTQRKVLVVHGDGENNLSMTFLSF